MVTISHDFFDGRTFAKSWNTRTGKLIKDWGQVDEGALPNVFSFGNASDRMSIIKPVREIPPLRPFGLAPRGDRKVFSPKPGVVIVQDLRPEGEPTTSVTLGQAGAMGRLAHCFFSADGKRVLTTTMFDAGLHYQQHVAVWDASNGLAIARRRVFGHRDGLYIDSGDLYHATAFSADGTRVIVLQAFVPVNYTEAIGAGAYRAVIWDIKEAADTGLGGDSPVANRDFGFQETFRTPDFPWDEELGLMQDADFSRDGGLVVTGFSYGTAVVWNATSGAREATLYSPEDMMSLVSVSFDPSRQRVAVAGGTQVCFWAPVR